MLVAPPLFSYIISFLRLSQARESSGARVRAIHTICTLTLHHDTAAARATCFRLVCSLRCRWSYEFAFVPHQSARCWRMCWQSRSSRSPAQLGQHPRTAIAMEGDQPKGRRMQEPLTSRDAQLKHTGLALEVGQARQAAEKFSESLGQRAAVENETAQAETVGQCVDAVLARLPNTAVDIDL